MTPEETAWVAGLFEGEGCISFSPSTRHTQLWVTSTDLDVLEKFHNIVGVGTIRMDEKPKQPHYKQCWRWGLHRREHIDKFLEDILPHLGKRRTEKAREVLQRPWKVGAPVKHVGCRIEKCPNPHYALGLCNPHYHREYRRRRGK